jgi:DNA-binding MarR family transcriptional regulator
MRSDRWTEGKVRWLEAMRWRRQIEKLLKPFELTLARWLVLEATGELVRETNDAVNQSAVAARCELDRMTVSQIMRTLDEQGLIDRGPNSAPPAYRIWLTPKGTKLCGRVRRRLAEP